MPLIRPQVHAVSRTESAKADSLSVAGLGSHICHWAWHEAVWQVSCHGYCCFRSIGESRELESVLTTFSEPSIKTQAILYLQKKTLNINEFSLLRKIIWNHHNMIKFKMKEKNEAKMTPKFCITRRMAVSIIDVGRLRYRVWQRNWWFSWDYVAYELCERTGMWI